MKEGILEQNPRKNREKLTLIRKTSPRQSKRRGLRRTNVFHIFLAMAYDTKKDKKRLSQNFDGGPDTHQHFTYFNYPYTALVKWAMLNN